MPQALTWTTFFSTFLICISVWVMLVFYTRRANINRIQNRRFTVISGIYLFGWWISMCVLGNLGAFIANPHSIAPSVTIALGILIPIFMGIFLLQKSEVFAAVIKAIPTKTLIGIQFYRVLGVIFLVLLSLNYLPAEFAQPAGWGDILVGITAPFIGWLHLKKYSRSKEFTTTWNFFGALDLIIAVATGFLTSQSPFQLLAFDNPNQLITAFPLVLIPVFAVPLSIVLHFVVWKKLRLESNAKLIKSQKSFAV